MPIISKFCGKYSFMSYFQPWENFFFQFRCTSKDITSPCHDAQCPTLPWLITQMLFIVCTIFLLIFILFREESKTKGQGRTLSDVVLARLTIVVGFYQIYFNFLPFSLKLFISLSLTRIFLHQSIREARLVEILKEIKEWVWFRFPQKVEG